MLNNDFSLQFLNEVSSFHL